MVYDENNENIANQTMIDKKQSDLVNGDNVLYNQTEVREFSWVVNGKDMKNRQSLTFKAYECLTNCGPETVEACPISET